MSQTLEESLVLEEIFVKDYEKVLKVTDKKRDLTAIICIHNTTLGPALGGIRIYPYATFDNALTDVLRLAKGMTYKSALSDTGLGGGKSVIIASPAQKSEELLYAFGLAVNRLQGSYICAEDVGCTVRDAMVINRATSYIVGLSSEKSSGDPGPFTAWGTLRGLQSLAKHIFGSSSLEGLTIAIQGLGSVGARLAELLFWEGAKLIISDIDTAKTKRLASLFGAQAVSPDEILAVECDILAPCAMGGIINSQTIPKMRCKAIGGCANNQLLHDHDGDELLRRGILYAPDFVINAGGLINVTQEIEPLGYNPVESRKKINEIYDRLLSIYSIAEKNRISTHAAALSLGDYRLAYGLGKRTTPVHLHHANVD